MSRKTGKVSKGGKGKTDADMYGRVENAGWDPENTGWPSAMVPQAGINRKQQMLNVMDQVGVNPQAVGGQSASSPNANNYSPNGEDY